MIRTPAEIISKDNIGINEALVMYCHEWQKEKNIPPGNITHRTDWIMKANRIGQEITKERYNLNMTIWAYHPDRTQYDLINLAAEIFQKTGPLGKLL